MPPPKRKRKPKGPPRTRWEKSADRENERRWKKAPLFAHAGLVPMATPAEREARFGPAFRERLDREADERQAAEEALGVELATEVQALVTPEKFAELEARLGRYPSRALFYRGILDELRPRPAPLAVEPVPRRRALPVVQEPLFYEVPGVGEVPAVGTDGKAIPMATIAEEHGIDLDRPALLQPVPCPDCQWMPVCATSAVDFNIHPRQCPSLLGFLLGLWESCPDCKALREAYAAAPYPPCDAHRAKILACQAEGHIPGPPSRWYLTGQACQRCAVALSPTQAA